MFSLLSGICGEEDNVKGGRTGSIREEEGDGGTGIKEGNRGCEHNQNASHICMS